jgi:hypothetical protein
MYLNNVNYVSRKVKMIYNLERSEYKIIVNNSYVRKIHISNNSMYTATQIIENISK